MFQVASPQNSAFERAIGIFRPSRAILTQANHLLHQYLQHEQLQMEVVAGMAQIATFVAQCLQQIRDLKGRKISGMGLAFSRLIGNCISIPLLLEQTNKFINVVPLEVQSKFQIENYLYRGKSIYEYMQLFELYINKLQLVMMENIGNGKYREIFIQFAWILYSDSREWCIRTDSDAREQNNCLMASVFYFMIRYSLEYIYPRELRVERGWQKRTIISKILQFLLNTFQIQQIELYKKIADKFDEYIQKLINGQVMRSMGYQTDFFGPAIIHLNCKQLQNRYQKRLQPKDIDYRVFRKQKCLTSIHKQALVHRAGMKKYSALSKSMTAEYRSHRTLNYQDLESPKDQREKLKSKANPQVSLRTNNAEMYTAKNFTEFKPHSSTSMIIRPSSAVPDGIDLQLYRYVNTLAKSSKRCHKSIYHQKSLQLITKYVSRINLSNVQTNKKSLLFTIYSVYVSLGQKIFEFEVQNQSIHICLISIALFIGCEMNQQINNEKDICAIFKEINGNSNNINIIDLWCCLIYFIKNDSGLPVRLIHSYKEELEKIICTQIWKNNRYIDEIAELAANYQKPPKFITFSESLIEYCQNFLKQLTNQLNISHQHCSYAYNCIKFILSANGNILQNQNIDQILMCALYISGKTRNEPILFLNIKEAYEILFKNRNRNLEEVFNKVRVNENGVGDIIYFYNTYFIESIKPFIPYMANPSLSLLHPLFQREISFKKQNYPINIINIMQTTKPKLRKLRLKINEGKSDRICRIIGGDRNETRVRIRPNSSIGMVLCDTEKINKVMESDEEEEEEEGEREDFE